MLRLGVRRGIFAPPLTGRVDPDDPEHKCLCGYEGESYDDHLAWSTLREMRELGYDVWPSRHA